jgi:rare lipoprotein A
MNRKSRNTSLKTPLRLWVLAVTSSFALSVFAVMAPLALCAFVVFSTARTVHADAQLSHPVTTMTAATPVANPTPESLASQEEAQKAEQTAIERGDRLHGIASWYGGVFNGRTTASGEQFDMNAMTACHPTLPFGSVVKVINHRNHRSVIVRITDRGDLVDDGRIIDLSYGAAQKLAMTSAGLARVDLQVLSLGRGN